MAPNNMQEVVDSNASERSDTTGATPLMTYTELLNVTIPAEPQFVSFARRAVQDVARQLQMDTDAIGDIMLAVGEACSNGVQYGADRPDRMLSISCRVSRSAKRKDDVLEIDIRNHGNGFAGKVDWSEHRMPAAETLADHGRGLPLMRSVVDHVDFFSNNGDTIVRLTKRIEG